MKKIDDEIKQIVGKTGHNDPVYGEANKRVDDGKVQLILKLCHQTRLEALEEVAMAIASFPFDESGGAATRIFSELIRTLAKKEERA